jgi:methylated-DNA-protein-cysteine methyltransferase-like protein
MKINFDAIYDVVVQIPKGRVATYGQIAELAGIPRQPRRVGYALSALPKNSGVPWHRVINANGEISVRSNGGPDPVQRRLLKQEGLVFDRAGRISLDRFRWEPRFH